MLTDEQNNRIELGRQIGNRGGEGCVFEVVGEPTWVAKRYHSPPDHQKLEKLYYQSRLSDSELLRIAAWPQSVLKENGRSVGFLMPKSDGKPIHLLYRPIDRKENFPTVTWQNLAKVCQNIAAAFNVLHSKAILMGDVNETNLIITARGETRFIDCDSFQITTLNGKSYPCEVGVSLWTPPELQGKTFGSLIRTKEHDLFGLAVLIFHILFMGRHPFAGVPKTASQLENPPTLESCIAKFQFVFTRRVKVNFEVPPHSLTLASLPDKLADLFEQAFLSTSRPSAAVWFRELGALAFQKCQWGHYFYRHLNDCPWCAIWNTGGPNFFVAVGVLDTILTSSTEIERFMAEIEKAKIPVLDDASYIIFGNAAILSLVPQISTLPVPPLPPCPFPSHLTKERKRYHFGWLLIAVSIVGMFSANTAIVLWIIGVIIGLNLVSGGKENPKYKEEVERRKAGVEVACKKVERHLSEMSQANRSYQMSFDQKKGVFAIEIREHQTNAVNVFRAEQKKLLDAVSLIVQKYLDLPAQEQAMVNERRERSQKEDFLRRHRISDYKIRNIGQARLNILAMQGYETAWDVKHMAGVPGLGRQSYAELRQWVINIEGQYTYDPRKPLSDTTKLEIRRDMQKREQEVLKQYQQTRESWLVLLRESDIKRLKQLRDTRISEQMIFLQDLNLSSAAIQSKLRNKLDELLHEYGQAIADYQACPKVN